MEQTSYLVYTRATEEIDIHKIVENLFLHFDGHGDESESIIESITSNNGNLITFEVPASRVNVVTEILARLKWFKEFSYDPQESINRSVRRH